MCRGQQVHTCNDRDSPCWEKKEKPACTSLHNAHAQIPHANEVLEQACSAWRWVGGRVAGSRLYLHPDNREELVHVHQRRVLRVSGFTVSWRGGHGDRRQSHWWLRGKWPPYTPAASWTSSWAATTGHAASLSYAATRGRILGGRLISGLSRSPSACEMAGFGYTDEDANGYSTAEDNDWQGTLKHTAVATTNHMRMLCTTPTEGEQPVANDQLLLKWDTLKMA